MDQSERNDMIPAMELPVNSEVVRFRGRVIPESMRITIGHPRHVRWKHDSTNAVAEFAVNIDESQVVVDCQSDGPFQLGDLFRRALDISQAIVDIIAFARGLSLTVVFDTVTHGGRDSPLVVFSPGVAEFCTSFTIEDGFDDVLKIVMEEPALFVALNDLNVSLSNHHLSPVNYGRVIESIRTMIAGDDAPIADAWEQMRTVLRVDRAYLQLVTDTSVPKRHGIHRRVEADTVAAISERTWRVMDRFITYRRRGNAQLPASEFPILTG
jgi:hypothetical protein